MARVVEESVARCINLNNKDSSRDNEPWFVKEEVTKVIEVGSSLGIDLNGKEQEMIDILVSREREDVDKLNQLCGQVLNNKDSSRDNEPWFVKEEVTKVIEVGSALGIDFNGKEQEMIDILVSREREDVDKLK
ncbi:hypothetical protein LWI29_011376 [Acer saccharum]|uniref:Uncharacterized protein n=1 Tax=Acer saccharum TaxID=4024 RepID=A0AA39SUU6_ACESA|nr:hypothetical protein LWI29_011376 [Acer saccharum]